MTLQQKVQKFKEYKRLEAEAKTMADEIAAEIKKEMDAAGQTFLDIGAYKVHYTTQTRSTLMKKELENLLGDLSEFSKTTVFRKFEVAG